MFPEKPCVKNVFKDKWASVHWSAAYIKERSWSQGSTAGKLRINLWSTTRFVPLSVLMDFPSFVLLKKCSGQLSPMPWRTGPSASRPARPPRPAAPQCAAPIRLALGMRMRKFWIRQIVPGHAMRENGSQRHLRRRWYIDQQPGTKSGSCPADRPVVNRRFCSSIRLHMISFVRVSEKSRQLSSMPWWAKGTVVFWANWPVGVLS